MWPFSLPQLAEVARLTMWMLVLLMLFSDVIAVGPTPGLKLTGLNVWENSGLPGVFAQAFANEYLFFRSYALTILSDAGYLDHLLNNLPSTSSLRVIDTIGAATGIVCALKLLSTQSTAPSSPEKSPTTQSSATTSDSNILSIRDIKFHSISIVKRMLRRGMLTNLLDQIVGTSDNILKFFITLDERYFPIDDATTSAAEQIYHTWQWDSTKDFWTNFGNFENLLIGLKDCKSSIFY